MRNKGKYPHTHTLVSETVNFCCSKSLGLQHIGIGTIEVYVFRSEKNGLKLLWTEEKAEAWRMRDSKSEKVFSQSPLCFQ